MEDIFKKIVRLKDIRKVPQFLFFSGVYFWDSCSVREQILEFKTKNKDIKEIDFIIESSGGSTTDAYRIIRTLHTNFEKVNIVVPFWAKSAATLITLGGTLIVMDEYAELGPLDVQLKEESDENPDGKMASALIDEHSLNRIEKRAQELYHSMFLDFQTSKDIKVAKSKLSDQLLMYISQFYKPLLDKIDPYEIGRKKRYLEIGEKYAERILAQYNSINSEDRIKFIDYIVNGCPDHSFIIDFDLISIFLPNVKKSIYFGEKYANTLTELSMLFVKNTAKLKHIGFIDESNIKSNIKINEVEKEKIVGNNKVKRINKNKK